MNWHEAGAAPLAQRTQILHMGSLLFLAVAAGLLMAFNRHNTFAFVVIGVLGTIMLPAAHVFMRRLLHALTQRETDERIVTQTREYLRRQQPWCPPSAPLLHAGVRMTPQGFQEVFAGVVARSLPARPVIFDVLPHPDTLRDHCDYRLAFPHLAPHEGASVTTVPRIIPN